MNDSNSRVIDSARANMRKILGSANKDKLS